MVRSHAGDGPSRSEANGKRDRDRNVYTYDAKQSYRDYFTDGQELGARVTTAAQARRRNSQRNAGRNRHHARPHQVG